MAMRCLIVDDSACFLRAAQLLLEQEGITVVGMASTGAEALQQAEELRPDVVLIDIALGCESGFELARRLGEGAHTESRGAGQPRIILISTRSEEDYEELIAASPAVGFLGKPDLSARAIQDLLSSRN